LVVLRPTEYPEAGRDAGVTRPADACSSRLPEVDMPSFSLRPGLVLWIGVITGCVLVLWTLRLPAQAPESKGKHVYSLQYIKVPAADGEIAGLDGCKSVSIAPVTHSGEPQLAALCEK
jgi:hypothetical protein